MFNFQFRDFFFFLAAKIVDCDRKGGREGGRKQSFAFPFNSALNCAQEEGEEGTYIRAYVHLVQAQYQQSPRTVLKMYPSLFSSP